ncbi:MAG: alpha/beta fold hydrolase [Myxococcales bacterium]|nr:alpha/beta fold hydrolase [Myxococcales bacterium]
MKLWRSLRGAAREAGAYARQAALIARDLEPIVPREVEDGDIVVVLLHGLFATAGVLRPLRTALERHRRVRVASFTYAPGPGADAVAGRLGDLVAHLPRRAEVHLVGHSMGGIIARYYAVTREDHRVRSTVTLATPFGGVRGAALLGLPFARDLAEDSAVLRTLRLESPARPIPHLSIVAGDDALTRTPVAHALPGGDVVILEGRGHNGILFDREAIRLVEGRIVGAMASRMGPGVVPGGA